ncbi:hypothetical protein BH24BAC1_BH24BAC1_12110 [soil metagenome]
MRKRLTLLLLPLLLGLAGFAQTKSQLNVSGNTFLLNGQPFPYTGISFFNALYNPTFNQSSEERAKWLAKFGRYGINVLRVWCQWDNKRGFVDAGPEATLYFADGRLRPQPLERLKALVTDADKQGMVVLVVLFARESWDENTRLAPQAADKAVAALTRELQPYRNIVFQIWNEHSERVVDHYKTIKAIDPQRLVSNSPGWGGELGDQQQNQTLDFLSPHTSRQNAGRHWEVAPEEVEYLLTRFRKPVVDDEPARNGTPEFGGPRNGSSPYDHILQIYQVWQLGGYIVYHHDMFQKGYGHPSIPPSGIPDPEFNPYHRQVLEFVGQRERYMPKRERRP